MNINREITCISMLHSELKTLVTACLCTTGMEHRGQYSSLTATQYICNLYRWSPISTVEGWTPADTVFICYAPCMCKWGQNEWWNTVLYSFVIPPACSCCSLIVFHRWVQCLTAPSADVWTALASLTVFMLQSKTYDSSLFSSPQSSYFRTLVHIHAT